MQEPKDGTRTSSFGLTPEPDNHSIEKHCQLLEKRLRAGEETRCEDFFREFPALATNADAALDLIYTEFAVRGELQQEPTPEEFLARFPQWRSLLDRQFQLAKLFEERESADAASPSSTVPRSASSTRFHVVQLLARGGIGQVMRAIDTELNREVAVKEILPKLGGVENVRERFLREAEITGRLEHPGVVPVYGLGEDATGKPFYAMRLVRGQSFLEAIEAYHASEGGKRDFRSLEFQKLLRRFLSVCETIAYAHSRGVIHRDIKPQNILLGPFGETLLVDWGLAKIIPADSTSAIPENSRADNSPVESQSALQTAELLSSQSANWAIELTQAAGALIGTPAFMSPEQARGDNQAVGPASDIYSLGATLHTLLTGRSRFADSDINETLQQVLSGGFKRPRECARDIPRALEAICLKAMALQPSDRYDSASAMADDIERYLVDEPVTAALESVSSRLSRWGRRNRKLALGGLATLLIITTISAAAAVRIHGERLRADRQSIEAMRKAARLAFDRGYQLMEQDQFGEGVLWLERALHHAPTEDFDMRRVILSNLSAARQYLLHRRAEFAHDKPLALSVFSADGKLLLTSEHEGTTRIWDVDQRKRLAELSHQPTRALAARFLGNHELLIVTAARKTLSLHRYSLNASTDSDASSSTPPSTYVTAVASVITMEHSTDIAFATLNDDASLVAFCGRKPTTVRVCRVSDGRVMGDLENSSLVQQMVFQPQSNWLAVVGANGILRVWKPNEQISEYTFVDSFEKLVRVEFMPDGKTLLAASDTGTVGCWDLASKQLLFDFGQQTGRITAVACSKDGQSIAAVWDHGVARAWTLKDRRPACEWLRFDRHTSSLSFRPQAHQMLINTRRESAVLWDLPDSDANSIAFGQGIIDSVDFSSDGKVAVMASKKGAAQLRETATGKVIGKAMQHRDDIKRVCFRPDGALVLTSSSDGTARLWNARSGVPHGRVLDHRTEDHSRVAVASTAYSPDNRYVATSDNQGFIRLWDGETGEMIRVFEKLKGIGLSLCFSPDADRILVGYSSPDNGVRMWSTESGELLWVAKQQAAVRSVAISPNGRLALSGGNDETARLWNADDGNPIGSELQNRGEVFVARFSPDSNLAVTGGYDATVRLWYTTTGLPYGEPMQHEALILDADFSDDGTRLLTGSSDRTARLWDVATCLPLSFPLRHNDFVPAVMLSPTNDLAFAGRLWKLSPPLPDQPDLIRRWVRLATQRSFTSGNNIQWLEPASIHSESVIFEEIVRKPWQAWQSDF